jgi:aspartyl-tRNA(Asn)/glutamyl-tRNA(Gln) amidotransferase subunit A
VRERLEAARFYPATDYIKAQRIRTMLMHEMAAAFEKCDVMAVPGGSPASKLPSPEEARSDVKPGSHSAPYRGGNTFIGDMTGMPGLVIPCGLTKALPVRPLSIQFYGPPFGEPVLYRVAHAYQSVTDWHTHRPPITAGTKSDQPGA